MRRVQRRSSKCNTVKTVLYIHIICILMYNYLDLAKNIWKLCRIEHLRPFTFDLSKNWINYLKTVTALRASIGNYLVVSKLIRGSSRQTGRETFHTLQTGIVITFLSLKSTHMSHLVPLVPAIKMNIITKNQPNTKKERKAGHFLKSDLTIDFII